MKTEKFKREIDIKAVKYKRGLGLEDGFMCFNHKDMEKKDECTFVAIDNTADKDSCENCTWSIPYININDNAIEHEHENTIECIHDGDYIVDRRIIINSTKDVITGNAIKDYTKL